MQERAIDKMRRVAALKRAELPEKEKKYNASSKARLIKILEKKLKTSFIGALSQFEEFFGRALWGHGKDDEDRTQDEKEFYEMWQQCRTNILNNGNNQIRAIENELQQYEVSWQRYQNRLIVPQPQPCTKENVEQLDKMVEYYNKKEGKDARS